VSGRLPGLGRDDPARVSEKDYTRQVTEMLELFKWSTCHVFPLMDSHGVHRTPTTARGWPDVLALRGPYVIAAELKGYSSRGDRGRLRPEQLAWLRRWAQVPTARAWVLDPVDPAFETLVSWARDPLTAPRIYGWNPSA
jgi:hypothetical protein